MLRADYVQVVDPCGPAIVDWFAGITNTISVRIRLRRVKHRRAVVAGVDVVVVRVTGATRAPATIPNGSLVLVFFNWPPFQRGLWGPPRPVLVG